MNLGPTSESLSPPDPDVDDSDEAVVEHEWMIVDRSIRDLHSFTGALAGHMNLDWANVRINRIQSSLQTIRELTEVRK